MIPLPEWPPRSGLCSLHVIVCGTACLLLVLDPAAGERRIPWSALSFVGLALATWAVIARWENPSPPQRRSCPRLRVDDLAVFLQVTLLIAAALSLVTADHYLELAGAARCRVPRLAPSRDRDDAAWSRAAS